MLVKLSGMIVNFGPGCVVSPNGEGSLLEGISGVDHSLDETVEEIWAMLEPERAILDLALTQARISLATLDKCDAAIDALGPKPAKRPKAEPAECPECGCEWPEVTVGCLGCQVRMNAAGI